MKDDKKILPKTTERVRVNTNPKVNQQIDQTTRSNIQSYAGANDTELQRRVHELENEWDTERTLEFSFSSFVLLSTYLGLKVNKKWFALGGLAAAFMMMHSLQGWCPPVPLIRSLGIRTAEEINREKTVLQTILHNRQPREINEASRTGKISNYFPNKNTVVH